MRKIIKGAAMITGTAIAVLLVLVNEAVFPYMYLQATAIAMATMLLLAVCAIETDI